MPKQEDAMTVQSLWRYAVKGLDRDELTDVTLRPGLGFPNDRRWAMQYIEQTEPFDPVKPQWVHKRNFLCAFTANELLGSFVTTFDDQSQRLTVSCRKTSQELLSVILSEETGQRSVERFFSKKCGQKVQLVEGTVSAGHHFGNTSTGFKHHSSGSIIHIVNTATVDAVAAAAGVGLATSRFRSNMVLEGIPAWTEFEWIGKRLRIGGATLECMRRTVRCEAINVDANAGQNKAEMDVPALLKEIFPQHGPYLGVYARVVSGGRVEIGSEVQVLHNRSHPLRIGLLLLCLMSLGAAKLGLLKRLYHIPV